MKNWLNIERMNASDDVVNNQKNTSRQLWLCLWNNRFRMWAYTTTSKPLNEKLTHTSNERMLAMMWWIIKRIHQDNNRLCNMILIVFVKQSISNESIEWVNMSSIVNVLNNRIHINGFQWWIPNNELQRGIYSFNDDEYRMNDHARNRYLYLHSENWTNVRL